MTFDTEALRSDFPVRSENDDVAKAVHAAADEIERLRAWIEAAVDDLGGDHRKDDGVPWCRICGTADGHWPCAVADTVSDLRSLLAGINPGKPVYDIAAGRAAERADVRAFLTVAADDYDDGREDDRASAVRWLMRAFDRGEHVGAASAGSDAGEMCDACGEVMPYGGLPCACRGTVHMAEEP